MNARRAKRALLALLPILFASGAAGCGDDPPAATPPTGGPAAARAALAGGGADAGPGSVEAGPPLTMELRESDFVETEGEHRDPFRNYAALFRDPPGAQRTGARVPVLLPQVSLDEMRLIAIVSGVGTPRAMLLDSTGVGTVVRRGDYLGRGDVVRGGPDGSAEFEINWRVSKILSDGLVLVREDPTSPGRAPLTRTIELHPEEAARRPTR